MPNIFYYMCHIFIVLDGVFPFTDQKGMTFVGHGSTASKSDGKVIEFYIRLIVRKPATTVLHIKSIRELLSKTAVPLVQMG